MIKTIIIFTILISFNSNAESSKEIEFNTLYKSAQYEKAIEVLNNIDKKELISGQVNYLNGLCYSRLQQYDKAISYFQLAQKDKNENIDLHYELGQALYASNELKLAREAFKRSIQLNFKKGSSLYYIAYISQLLEEYPQAKESYLQIINLDDVDLQTKQVAEFQLSETLYAGFKSKSFKTESEIESVSKYVLPLMSLAYELNNNSDLSNEIKNRIDEINKEYGLDPNTMINGRRLGNKRYSGFISQKIKFDDNVTYASGEASLQQTKKNSLISATELYAKYDFSIDRKIIISPDLRFNFLYHTNQSDQSVYQNDAYTLFTSVKNQIEHTINNLPASFLINLNFGQTSKAWKQTHQRELYSTEYSIELGEQFSYFQSGETTLKSKFKNYIGENKSVSNRTINFNGSQIVGLKGQKSLIYYAEVNFINNFNSTTSSTNTYLLRVDYLMSEVWPKYTLGLALTTTITDTKKMSSTRGTEVTLTPSLDLTRNFSQNIKSFANLEINKNFSKSDSYNYLKNVITIGFQFNF